MNDEPIDSIEYCGHLFIFKGICDLYDDYACKKCSLNIIEVPYLSRANIEIISCNEYIIKKLLE